MKYIHTPTGEWPINDGQLSKYKPEELAIIWPGERKWYDSEKYKEVEGSPKLVNDKWEQVWEYVLLSETEIKELTEQEIEALQLEASEELKRTDYWALSDRPPLTQQQKDYREALREVVRGNSNILPIYENYIR